MSSYPQVCMISMEVSNCELRIHKKINPSSDIRFRGIRAIYEFPIVLYSRENLQFENINCESFCWAPFILHGGSITKTSNLPTYWTKSYQLKYLTSQFKKVPGALESLSSHLTFYIDSPVSKNKSECFSMY